ncbi:MAG: DUF1611 domain-containing protein [Acidobacteria bacterium]|jgi:uncharacterized NAD-dependent epimerase/dehydratase family protein|nr:DUF1611 domain-containing protein [Acidobacteriota bacterium]
MRESTRPEGNAIVYCEGAFGTTNGKTAHGLTRFTRRYRVLSVVDSGFAGRDAGEVLDGTLNGIPIVPSIAVACSRAEEGGQPATHLVIGLAPDGGRLARKGRTAVVEALTRGLHVDSGLHDFLSDDPELVDLAAANHCQIRDIRKPPSRSKLHFFSGKIEAVDSFRVAVLGTDSAVGKRTTAWLLVQELEARGHSVELVGTGQTAWLQGARYGIVLDSLVNDFVSGEIEHAVWSAWKERHPAFLVVEGQGSLMNPAYPGGFEILAAARPDAIVLQHAPGRAHYDGFPGHPIHPLWTQIEAIELLSDRPVVAVAINHEGLDPEEVPVICETIARETGVPVCDVILQGAGAIVEAVNRAHLERLEGVS